MFLYFWLVGNLKDGVWSVSVLGSYKIVILRFFSN